MYVFLVGSLAVESMGSIRLASKQSITSTHLGCFIYERSRLNATLQFDIRWCIILKLMLNEMINA